MFNSRILRKGVLLATVAILAAGGVLAMGAAKKRRSPGMMWAIPAKSLLCVRINKFDETLDSVNAFLEDVAPAETDAKAALLSKLTGFLGSDRLRGVNKRGNIAIFALSVPGESAGRGPMGNMFIGALLPVTKYENFISRNPNCGEPDDEGISTITVNGKVQGLATNYRRYALLCPPDAREKLIKVKKLMSQRKRSLGASLDSDTRKQAASSPVWIYLNVKQGSQMIQPILFGGLEKMKAELEKAKESGEKLPIDPSGIISFYGGIIKTVLEGTENVTVALAPSAEACNVTLGLKPVGGSMMAKIVGAPLEGDLDNMLGYLEDGSIFNVAMKVDRESLKISYTELFKLMGMMIPGGLPEEDLEQLQGLLTRGIDALGDSAAITFGINNELSPPFVGKYVIDVKDQAAFEQVLEKELQLMEEGVFAEMYKGFGMEMDVEIDREVSNHIGVPIGGAKVLFKAGGDDDMQTQMFEKMFGDGLDYRWAFAKGNCVYAVGSNADGTIRELIDQVRSGGPKQISSEIRTALEAIGESEDADVIGTINYVRAITMAFGFMPLPEDFDTTQLKVASKSNIAFAGRTTDEGKLALQIVLPKKHVQEIQSVFKTLIPQIEKHQKELREKHRSEQKESNAG
ncbi:MAG: hypothetical protein HQ580_11690 [Planctomycetes bacterium]|nr:hypothetical protein [Planctomycetota bacterium]